MDRFVLPVIFVCLVIGNNIDWGVNGIEKDMVLDDLHSTVKEMFRSLIERNTVSKEKCFNKTRSNDAYDMLTRQMKEFEAGNKELFEIEKNIIAAKYGGDHNTVFKEYCEIPLTFNYFYAEYFAYIYACLDEDEKNLLNIIQNFRDGFESFVCQNEGENLFFSEGGPKCILDKLKPLEHCLRTTIVKYIPTGEQTLSSLLAFKFGEDECKSMSELQVCVIAELKKCEKPTFAEHVKTYLESVHRSTRCPTSAGVSARHPTIFTILLCSMTVLLSRIGFY